MAINKDKRIEKKLAEKRYYENLYKMYNQEIDDIKRFCAFAESLKKK